MGGLIKKIIVIDSNVVIFAANLALWPTITISRKIESKEISKVGTMSMNYLSLNYHCSCYRDHGYDDQIFTGWTAIGLYYGNLLETLKRLDVWFWPLTFIIVVFLVIAKKLHVLE